MVDLFLQRGVVRQTPWHLATLLADSRLAVKMYRKKIQAEQHFRDVKRSLIQRLR